MSFVTQEDILNLVENMFTTLVREVFPDKKINQVPWPRIKYSEVMAKYGTDKPDLRKDKNDPNELVFVWVVDFPLFVQQTKEDFFYGAGEKYAPSHHMFTAPKEEDISLLDSEPLKVKSYQHDLVLNGYEVGGGSIRIHDPKLQKKIFSLIGFTEEQKAAFISIVLEIATMVKISGKVKVILEDPDDDAMLETAVVGNADYLISADQHLLKLKEFAKVKIVTASEFLGT